jgi:hypothetical protein
VSQPQNRGAKIAVPGGLDKSLGEFWVANPWQIVREGHNLSAFERNRTWMNVGGSNFLDVSFLTAADSDGDGRSAVAADFRNNGRQELIVRQVGGGALLLFENHFPQRHYLKVTLRGKPEPGKRPTSNRQGIGARLTAHAGGRQVVREMYPINSYRSQAVNLVHFGLGDAPKVDRLVVRWPSGRVQELKDIPADRHVVVEEGKATVETVEPGRRIEP